VVIRCAVLTISDRSSRGERPDASGPALTHRCLDIGWQITATRIVPDELSLIQAVLTDWADQDTADLILTPEATQAVVQRLAPGIAEAMRAESLRKTPHAMLSRGIAGIRKRTLIINLPGSPKAALENLEVVIPVLAHAVELLHDSTTSESGHTLVK
jgi:molybdopterin adenylyltransferase